MAFQVPGLRQSRQRFTLIELPVVVLTIAVLIALLPLVIQSVYEAAQGSLCTNNRKSLGLAARNIHPTSNTFPSVIFSLWDFQTIIGWGVGS